MAKKGDASKALLTKTILGMYPNNSFVKDKCIYINFKESNELAQVKLTLTCPNVIVENPNGDATPVATTRTSNDGIDFDQFVVNKQTSNVEFTEKEKETVNHILNLLDF